MINKLDAKTLSSKYFWENYAKLSLPLCGFLGDFTHSDCPDLQDFDNNIGIEVVEVMSKTDGIFRALWNANVGKGLTSNEFANKLQKPELKAQVIPDMPAMVACIGEGDAKDLIYPVLDFIDKKSKLFSNYKHFQRNGLYLFCHLLWEENIENLYTKILTGNYAFDFYIINLPYKLFVIDIARQKIEKYEIPESFLNAISANNTSDV